MNEEYRYLTSLQFPTSITDLSPFVIKSLISKAIDQLWPSVLLLLKAANKYIYL